MTVPSLTRHPAAFLIAQTSHANTGKSPGTTTHYYGRVGYSACDISYSIVTLLSLRSPAWVFQNAPLTSTTYP